MYSTIINKVIREKEVEMRHDIFCLYTGCEGYLRTFFEFGINKKILPKKPYIYTKFGQFTFVTLLYQIIL